MTALQTKQNNFIWIFSFLIVLIGLLFALMGLSEFYNVKFGGKESAYPFGGINDNPWYYQNALIYSRYMLGNGLLFLTATLLTLWGTIKKKKIIVIIGGSLIIIFFCAHMISAGIECCVMK